MTKLSIIIPACNEAARIVPTIMEYITHYAGLPRGEYEILVISNGCTDKTADIIAELAGKFPQVKSKVITQKIGKGRAIVEGFGISCGETIAFVDADGATPAPEIDKLLKNLQSSEAVIGSRWLPQSNILVKQPLLRRIASRGFNIVVRVLFGLPFKDTQCGSKAFRRQALAEVIYQLTTSNFAFDVELLYLLAKRGYRILELPITWADKANSTLKLRKDVITMFFQIIRLRLRAFRSKEYRYPDSGVIEKPGIVHKI